MPTEVLTPGIRVVMEQNKIYALPGMKCIMFCDTPGVTFQHSTAFNFSTVAPVTLSADGYVIVWGGWIRSTAGLAAVLLAQD